MSIPVYSMLPAVEEWIMERGWTRAYTRVSDVGLGWHILYFVAFMTSVEFGVYWMHRLLHDIKPGYKYAPISVNTEIRRKCSCYIGSFLHTHKCLVITIKS